jgi:hypothetical protein
MGVTSGDALRIVSFEERKDVASINGLRAIDGEADFQSDAPVKGQHH